MSEALLEVLDMESGRVLQREPIRVNGRQATIEVQSERIESRALVRLDALAEDLIEIAACIFAADTGVRRGGPTRADFGAHWRRRLKLTIPVVSLEFWSDPEVTRAVVDAVSFLSDDAIELVFSLKIGVAQGTDFLKFDPIGDDARQVDEVILFSGGLDSLTGALETLATTTKRIALVSHRSAQKIIPHQDRLAAALADRYPGRVIHIPVRANRVGKTAVETTQRTRSFLFSALAFAVAQAFGAACVRFFENGIVSHNLPISAQVIGSMATRTTHPKSIRQLSDLLRRLNPNINLANPFEWLTKTQVVDRLRSNGGADLLKDTVSCSRVRMNSTLVTHCGQCSQCLDRRFAVLACGLGDHETDEMYEVDVLTGARMEPRSQVMALDWTLHARRLAEVKPGDFVGRFGGELARICEGYSGLDATSLTGQVLNLHVRHGMSVRKVLEEAIRANASLIERGALPPTSLLGAFVSRQTGELVPVRVSAPIRLARAGEDGADGIDGVNETPGDGVFPLRVRFSRPEQGYLIEVHHLGTVRGSPARIAHELMPTHVEDRAAGLEPAGFRFRRVGELATSIKRSKDTVTQSVSRCRRELAEFHEGVFGKAPDRPLLIENKRQHGYRLDPTCRVDS